MSGGAKFYILDAGHTFTELTARAMLHVQKDDTAAASG